jgi:hypothetical protein
MATYIITLTTAGADTGPFNLYSNVDGYVSAFESNVSKAALTAGFTSYNVPIGTTQVKISSIGKCTNSTNIIMPITDCYRFLPNSTYLLSGVHKPTYSYIMGAFDQYEETGVVTNSRVLIKLNIDLTINHTFTVGTGFDQVLYTGSAVREQADGKLICSGTFTSYQGVNANRIIRLNTDGTRDNTFVIGTGFDNFTQIPYISSSGQVYVTGFFNNYNGTYCPRLARLNADGSFDPTLVIGSGFNSTTLSVLENADGTILVSTYAGNYNGTPMSGLIQLLHNGTVDPAFNVGTGLVPAGNNFPNYMARIPGETSFFVAGFFTTYKGIPANRIIKIKADGSIDTSFVYGTGLNNKVSSIHIIWGNKILLIGDSDLSATFTQYNGILAKHFVVLNNDGSILFTPGAVGYETVTVVGNYLFAKTPGNCLQVVYINGL